MVFLWVVAEAGFAKLAAAQHRLDNFERFTSPNGVRRSKFPHPLVPTV